MQTLEQIINQAWEDRSMLQQKDVQEAINHIVDQLDTGKLRVAEPLENGEWQVNDWVKKAVILYFPICKMETIEVPPFEFHDKSSFALRPAKFA